MKEYVYYSTQRPIAPGTHPKEGVIQLHNYDKRSPVHTPTGIKDAWGYLIYNRELTLKEVCDYELTFVCEVEKDDE